MSEDVKIKALKWERIGSEYEGEEDVALTSIGEYSIEVDGFSYSPHAAHYLHGPTGLLSQHPDVPSAKAAAQADYESRIRSALST